MPDRPRILVLGEAGAVAAEWLRRWPDAESVPAESLARGLELLDKEHFDAVLANPGDRAVLDNARRLLQAQRILAAVPDGLALVDFDLRVRWANPTFQAWCGGNALGRGFYDALGSPQLLGPDYCPFHTRPGRPRRPSCRRRRRAAGRRHCLPRLPRQPLHRPPRHAARAEPTAPARCCSSSAAT